MDMLFGRENDSEGTSNLIDGNESEMWAKYGRTFMNRVEFQISVSCHKI